MSRSLLPMVALVVVVVVLVVVVDCTVAPAAQADEPKHAIKKEVLMVPTRDGVRLAAEVWRPDAPGKFPALLLLRYWQTGHDEAKYFVPKGYACVMVDSRGRGKSEGKWELYVNEPRDGFDVHQWLGMQPWCNGRIGTYGQSYNAFTQLMPAVYGSEYVKCLFPVEGQESNFGHIYNDGVMQLNVVFTAGFDTTGPTAVLRHRPIDDPHFRRLPLIDVAKDFPDAFWVKDWIAHPRFDDYWKRYSVYGKYDRIKVPAYITSGWYDNLVHEGFKVFTGLRKHGGSKAAREQTRIRVGATPHGGAWGQFELMNRWYDYWLKDVQNGIDKEPAVQVQVMATDRWRTGEEWPFPQVKYTPYYLGSGGKANSSAGDGTLGTSPPAKDSTPDRFTYDPKNPVYTLGGQISTNPEVWGPKDRQKTQQRSDILVYTTDPLEKDTEVTGPVEVKLFAASSAVDTDFTATLTDVHPSGKAVHICEGIRGVTFRESLENPTPIEPGKVYEYTISLWETSILFRAGHRIRLEISSSNFPRYARNQNTGLPFGTSAEIKKAEQTIYHDEKRPSRLILPLMPLETSLTFPGKEWQRITAEEAGFEAAKLGAVFEASKPRAGAWGGVKPDDAKWGAVLTRGGYIVQTWGDPTYKYQSASLGKCITYALFGITVERGLIKPDDPIAKYWTGKDQLSHPHKYLDAGHHKNLTWRQLVDHEGGFVLESGFHWRMGKAFNDPVPDWAKCTRDPDFDNYAHRAPGQLYYSSGGYWRLGQALTAVWKKDLKQVIDDELLSHIGIPAERWDWTPGKTVRDTRDWYPDYPGYGGYVDAPYEIEGHVVRGAPGWVVMSSEDLARFGLLVATRGVWNGKRLIDPKWLHGHAGLDVHVVGGDPDSYVSIAKINCKDFPFGQEIGTGKPFAFPKELIAGPVRPAPRR